MLTMTSALDRVERLFGERNAVIDKEGTFTWNQHMDRVRKVGSMLIKLGIGAGDRFGIVSENSFRYTELLHAGYWMGAIPVPINHRLAPPEIKFILEDADCSLLALGEAFLPLLDAGDLAPWRDKGLYIGPEKPDIDPPQYEIMMAEADAADAIDPGEDDLALLLYTGGTTGRSKGVKLSHKNIVSNGMQIVGPMSVGPKDVYLHVAPMFHAADLLYTAFVLTGAAHSYLPVFSGDAFLQAVQDYGVTKTMLAPTMIIMTLKDCDIDNYDLSSLRLFLYGSSPMAAEWVKRAMERFKGTEIMQGYGLTETSPIVTTLSSEDHRTAIETGETDILRAAGRAVIGIDLRICDDDGNEVAQGEAGEVVVRGPNVTSGYLNRPEENEKSFRNGWFHTGDVGMVDENDVMYLLDRKKDMIISGGENIYTSEVEAALYQHDGVFEAAVVGIPDEKYGEALFAVIVPAPGATLTKDDIIDHCREKIAGYKIPRQMDFVDELPKSAMGKILKTELRRIYGK